MFWMSESFGGVFTPVERWRLAGCQIQRGLVQYGTNQYVEGIALPDVPFQESRLMR